MEEITKSTIDELYQHGIQYINDVNEDIKKKKQDLLAQKSEYNSFLDDLQGLVVNKKQRLELKNE